MEIAMKERPILFNAEMVNAILAGNKTQTRRIMKPQPVNETAWVGGMHCLTWIHKEVAGPDGWLMHNLCPLGKVGDRLWVRETWNKTRIFQAPDAGEVFVYAACDNRTDYGGPWKPSIHMPRAASRITLEITAVRVERLQDISEEDALAEGVRTELDAASAGASWYDKPRRAFQFLSESIYGAESWATNPWVWVIEFKKVTQ